MKNLMVMILSLVSINAYSNADNHLICRDKSGQRTAYLTLAAESTYKSYMMSECNGGVGDEFTGCRDKLYHYEYKAANIKYYEYDINFAAVRFAGSEHEFSGGVDPLWLRSTGSGYMIFVTGEENRFYLICESID